MFACALAERRKASIQKKRKESHLPHKTFDTSYLNPGEKRHIELLETLTWLHDATDLTIIGRCDSGKTALATHLGELAQQEGMRVFYRDIDGFLNIMRGKDRIERQNRKFRYITGCDLLISGSSAGHGECRVNRPAHLTDFGNPDRMGIHTNFEKSEESE